VERRRLLLLAALLGLISVCAYAPSIGGGFIFDDKLLIESNPYVHSFQWWWRWLTTDFWDLGRRASTIEPRLTYYRPLVIASYAVEWALGGRQPDLFHASNLLWHALGSALTFFTLRRWTGATLPALIAALLVSVHPTKAESVAWISGRPDVMCLVFLLIASAGMARRLRGERYALPLEVFGSVGAYLVKETALVLPMFAVVEAWVAMNRPPLNRGVLAKLARAALPQAAVAVAYLGCRMLLLPLAAGVQLHPELRSLKNRPQLVLETFGRAAELIVFPRNMHVQRALLTYDHQGKLELSAAYALVGLVFVGLAAAAMVGFRRRLPAVTLALAFFVVAFLPTSNITPTRLPTVISERFLYIPLLGLGFGLATALNVVLQRRSARVSLAASAIAAVLLAFGSSARAADYSDERAYWSHELDVNPRSLEALTAQMSLAVSEQRYDDALLWLKRAHQVGVNHFRPTRVDLGLVTTAVELLTNITVDAERRELLGIARFHEQLAGAALGTAELRHPKAQIKIEVTEATRKVLLPDRIHFVFARGEILARLGDDQQAVTLLRRALQQCADCRTLLPRAALPLAAAGDYAAARELLGRYGRITGERSLLQEDLVAAAEKWAHRAATARGSAERTHAKAMELSTLGYFGRAFELMQPHEPQFENVRDVALGYGELAWRAGHYEAARRVLRLHLPPAEVAKMTAHWHEELGRSRSH
jgi:tetratricopeptide (TPR) repeat protein